MNGKTVVIVGAGVMGTSAALAIKKKYPQCTVYLVDDQQTSIEPASRDTGKIVRTAYLADAYVKLAGEAMAMWKADSLYKDHWHQSGWFVVERSVDGKMDVTSGPQEMTRERFSEIFPNARMDQIAHLTFDASTAWVEASRALEATIKSTASMGVIARDGRVTELVWNGATCTGVLLSDGTEISGDSVLLAAGYGSMSLLNTTSHDQTVGVSLLGVQLDDQQYAKYENMPIVAVNGLGEILPPNRDKIIKINNARSFAVPDLCQVEAALPLTSKSPYFDENLELLETYLPELKDAPIAYRRYCLISDYLTETQDFHICPVAGRAGVYLASGGSFHGWKFLPNIGQYIVRMMDGDETFYDDWSRWVALERDARRNIHDDVVPKRAFGQ
ncbi:MAG: hypothetical protein M1818_005575 [Claussenomyces sp. TS43310]|nr:MAG: hypothetical protein M1818_005575 [Claussenomyces sp. TS43310]